MGRGRFYKIWSSEVIKTLLLMAMVVLGVLLFRWGLSVALRTDYPLHTPISSSMEPTLNIGDLLIVEGVVKGEEINADPVNGDIIVFRKPTSLGEFIVHRAIQKMWNPIEGKYYFKTKGDNNSQPDSERVQEDYIVGRVLWRIPFLGYIKIFLGTPVGIIATIALFVALILLERGK